MTSALQEQATAFRQWCIEAALPYWAVKGLHPAGGFHERLLMDGSPDAQTSRRVRVSARMTYVYSHAAYLGWYDRAREVSDIAFSFLREVSKHPVTVDDVHIDQGCPHLLSQNGEIIDHGRDLYDQAFLLLACAWRIRAFNDPQAVKLAEDTTAFLDEFLHAPDGGWFEGIPHKARRRQNPHMHLFEAFIALFMATGDEMYREKAHKLYALFRERFYDAQTGLVTEFFADDFAPHGETGHLHEPGHALEWVTLLDSYTSACAPGQAPEDLPTQMARLFETAVTLGQNTYTGFVFDQIATDHTITDYGHRSWTTAEFIKACLVIHRRRLADTTALAARLLSRFMDIYLTVPAHGGWRDHCGVNGVPKGRYMEASTFYHLMSLAAVLDVYLKKS